MYEKEFSSQIINSISDFNALKNLGSFIKRAEIIKKYQNNPDFEKIKENATRVIRILKDFSKFDVNINLFNTVEEKELYEAIKLHNADINNLDVYIKSLDSLIKPTVKFFDKVLVMDKDEAIKTNRLALLNNLSDKFRTICNFEKL